MTYEQIRQFLILGREFGLTSLRLGTMEATFGPERETIKDAKAAAAVLAQEIDKDDERMPSDDELLFASCPSGPPNIRTEPPAE